jgi:flagellar biosynthesis GTPase FlhF
MSSLVDLPEIVGFFSYSREDDEAFRGTLSAVRDAIQRELAAQLGRSKATFRLWQDKEAIAPGKLWETEIKTGVEQSVFFIPIVTPRAVNSDYCKFEFEAFLARERALGRSDLVFPILYVAVPALANEAQWRNHPVLSVIGKRQYVDWQTFRYADVPTPAMREEIARFCNKIVEALYRSWLSPEERQQQEGAETQDRAENVRRRQEAEAKQRDEEEARREAAEAQRSAEQRRQQEKAQARQRAEDERRRRAEGETRRNEDEAGARRITEDRAEAADEVQAYEEIATRYDATVLQAFLDRYPSGKRADAVRKRLIVLKTQQKTGFLGPILLGVLVFIAFFGIVLMIGGAFHR